MAHTQTELSQAERDSQFVQFGLSAVQLCSCGIRGKATLRADSSTNSDGSAIRADSGVSP